jgi:hypothetical protein
MPPISSSAREVALASAFAVGFMPLHVRSLDFGWGLRPRNDARDIGVFTDLGGRALGAFALPGVASRRLLLLPFLPRVFLLALLEWIDARFHLRLLFWPAPDKKTISTVQIFPAPTMIAASPISKPT